MANNIYYGVGIDQNKMFQDWMDIFETKDKSADLLFSIVESDNDDEEDFSIGCQAIFKVIFLNGLWVSESLFNILIEGINLNIIYIEDWLNLSIDLDKYGFNKDWYINRDYVIKEFLNEIDIWPKVISNNYDSSVDLSNIIAKQLVLGIDIKDVFSDIFKLMRSIAVKEYGIKPTISVPSIFSKKLEDILINLRKVERAGGKVGDIIKDVELLYRQKNWLI